MERPTPLASEGLLSSLGAAISKLLVLETWLDGIAMVGAMGDSKGIRKPKHRKFTVYMRDWYCLCGHEVQTLHSCNVISGVHTPAEVKPDLRTFVRFTE